MKFNILDLLLPRETKFYTMMSKQAELLLGASKELRALVTNLQASNNDEVLKNLVRIKELEKSGDKVERSVIDELDKTFITPLDREDIHHISMNMDQSLDLINSLARKFEIYDIRVCPAAVMSFCDILVGITDELIRLMSALPERKGLQEIIRLMHELEKRGDDTFNQAMASLFKDNYSPVDIIKYKEVYEDLEEIIDSVDGVGKFVRGIMVKLG